MKIHRLLPHRRSARIGVLAAFAATLAAVALLPLGCMPAVRSTESEMAAIHRASLTLTAPPQHTVSYRTVANPNARRIIFVHGSPGDWKAWADYLVEPPGAFDLIAIDRPGYGESGKAPVTSYAEQARAIEPFLINQGGGWPILVGHSLGGPIVARAAADYPDRVGGLLILAGSLDPTCESPRWYTRIFASRLTRWVLPGPLKQSNLEMLASLTETQLLAPLLERITCPVIVVHGAKDNLVPAGNLNYQQRMLKNGRSTEFIMLPKHGHFIPWEQEPLVRELISKLATN